MWRWDWIRQQHFELIGRQGRRCAEMAAGSPLPTLTEEGILSQASDTIGRSSLNTHVLRGLVGEKNILILQPTSVWKITIAVPATLCTGHT